MNPPHIWHMRLISESQKDNDLTVVLLGSNWDIDNNNPLNFFQRREILLNNFSLDTSCLVIDEIIDEPGDYEWVLKLKDLLFFHTSEIWDFDLNIYCWDLANDSAIKAISEYKSTVWIESINYYELSRNDKVIYHNWKQISISATNLRDAISSWDNQLADKIAWYKIDKNYSS